MLDLVVGQVKEVKLQEEDGTVKMKSRGLGDDIEKFTKFTGIKKAVDIVADKFNKDCGCDQRRDSLNRIFPYNR